METMEVRDVIFMTGVVLAILVFNWYRNQMLIKFFIFCGQENPEPDFAQVVNPLHYVNLDVYQQSLKDYFTRLIASDNGDKVAKAYRSLCSIDKESKEKLCRDVFIKALLTADAKKIADIYVTIVRTNPDNSAQVLPFLRSIFKQFSVHKKELLRIELDQERIAASIIERNEAVSEKLMYAMLEVGKN